MIKIIKMIKMIKPVQFRKKIEIIELIIKNGSGQIKTTWNLFRLLIKWSQNWCT